MCLGDWKRYGDYAGIPCISSTGAGLLLTDRMPRYAAAIRGTTGIQGLEVMGFIDCTVIVVRPRFEYKERRNLRFTESLFYRYRLCSKRENVYPRFELKRRSRLCRSERCLGAIYLPLEGKTKGLGEVTEIAGEGRQEGKGEEEARGKGRGHGKEGKMKVKKGREGCVEREMEKAIARG